MGNWAVVIRGIGAHHDTGNSADANRMTARFVSDLKNAGHQIQAATFTHGGEDDVSNPGYEQAHREAGTVLAREGMAERDYGHIEKASAHAFSLPSWSNLSPAARDAWSHFWQCLINP